MKLSGLKNVFFKHKPLEPSYFANEIQSHREY